MNKLIPFIFAFLFGIASADTIGITPISRGGTGAKTAAQARANLGIIGGGNALTANPLSQFAATTSAQLRGVLSDESGTGIFLTDNGTFNAGTLAGALSATGTFNYNLPDTITVTANAGAVDVTKGYGSATNNANTTLTFSTDNVAATRIVTRLLINSSGTNARTFTFDTVTDFAVTVPANSSALVQCKSQGASGWALASGISNVIDLAANATPAGTQLVETIDPTTGVSTKSTLTQLGISGGTWNSTAANTQTQNALGTTSVPGFTQTNTTAAAAGAQQVSPAFEQIGQGWKTTATAASQTVKFRCFVLPVQGAANPTAVWQFQSSINGSAYANVFTVDSAGAVSGLSFTTAGASFATTKFELIDTGGGSGGVFHIGGRGYMQATANGVWLFQNEALSAFTRFQFGGTTASFAGLSFSGTTITANLADGTAGGTFAFSNNVTYPKTITAAGTTGAQTINKLSGTVNFAAAATSLVVTNSLVDANSIITCNVGTNDTTMKSVSVVAGAGSFTLYANAAATAETRVNFRVTN